MTKAELEQKVNNYNASGLWYFNFKNNKCDKVKNAINNLKAEWTTSNGKEIVNELESLYNSLEETLNEIDSIVQAQKNQELSVSFDVQTEEKIIYG